MNTSKDQATNIQELKTSIREFCADRDWDQFHNPKDLAIGLITESSELLELFRFQSNEQCQAILADPSRRKNVTDELADAFFFILRFAQMFDIDLSTALNEKMTKNALKYPVEKAKGKNAKYDEL